MSKFWEELTTVLIAIVGVAMAAVLVSKKSNTAAVIQAGASGINNMLGVAEAPVTGASYTPDLTYPGSDMTASFGYGS